MLKISRSNEGAAAKDSVLKLYKKSSTVAVQMKESTWPSPPADDVATVSYFAASTAPAVLDEYQCFLECESLRSGENLECCLCVFRYDTGTYHHQV